MKPLKRTDSKLYHYEDGILVEGANASMRGDCSNLWGNCSGLSGNCSNLCGNCTELIGDLDAIPQDARPCNISEWVEK